METVTNTHIVTQAYSAELQQDTIEVPLLPEVASKVVRLAQSSDSNAEDLAKLIQSDQPLAGHVMRIANSALYSPNSTMVSLQQAITRLGMQIIADIALAASVNSKMFNAPGYAKYITAQLKFSLHSGLWAKEVARKLRKNVEASFLSGLLHDIGRPVSIQALLEIARKQNVTLAQEEVLALADHFQTQTGVKVVSVWEMPSSVKDVVIWFNNYADAGKAQEQTMIVYAAALITRSAEDKGKFNEAAIDELYEHPVFADLNLYRDDLERILEKQEQVKNTLEVMSE